MPSGDAPRLRVVAGGGLSGGPGGMRGARLRAVTGHSHGGSAGSGGPFDWRTELELVAPDVTLLPGCSRTALAAAEGSLGFALPRELVEFLGATDGVYDSDCHYWYAWSLERLVDESFDPERPADLLAVGDDAGSGWFCLPLDEGPGPSTTTARRARAGRSPATCAVCGSAGSGERCASRTGSRRCSAPAGSGTPRAGARTRSARPRAASRASRARAARRRSPARPAPPPRRSRATRTRTPASAGGLGRVPAPPPRGAQRVAELDLACRRPVEPGIADQRTRRLLDHRPERVAEPLLVGVVVLQQALGDRQLGHRPGRDVAHDHGVGVHAVDQPASPGANGRSSRRGVSSRSTPRFYLTGAVP